MTETKTPAAALGDRLRAMRETAGISQTAMAKALGVDQSHISRAETGASLAPARLRTWARVSGQPGAAGELVAMLADVRAGRARAGVTGRAKPSECAQHHGDPAGCAGRTHVYSFRAAGDLMAEVAGAAGSAGASAFIIAALQEKLGKPPQGRRKPPAVPAVPVFRAPPAVTP
jgi:transcriptional regulator with XRE-family HTH domain